MASTNEVVIACAGSGKTTYLVDRALADPTKRALIITYTNENLREIKSRLWHESAGNHASRRVHDDLRVPAA
ncbi:MAG: UvrD-helicase domain-containing protein [Marmoricola sp.]